MLLRCAALQSRLLLRRPLCASPFSAASAEPPEDPPVVAEVRRACEAHALLQPGDSVVACVSGGVDSVALLLALARLAPAWRLRLHVLHFNHALRAESEGEAVLVASLAARLGCELHTRTAEAGGWHAAGLPAQARAWRRTEALQLAARLAEGGGRVRIALGHQAEDDRETLLLKLLRGAHLSRLRGLSPRRGAFIRPLLGCGKAQLAAFVTASGERWAEDASNADPSKGRRNAVRLQLVPLLQALSGGGLDARLRDAREQSALLRESLRAAPRAWAPRARAPALADLADAFSSDEEEEECDAEEEDGQGAAPGLSPGELDLAAWLQLPPLARLDQLHAFVQDATRAPLSYGALRELAARCAAPAARLRWAAHAGGDWLLVRAGARLRMRRKGGEAEAEAPLGGGLGVVRHPPGWTVRLWPLQPEPPRPAMPLRGLPAGPLRLRLRARADGDALIPPGGRGRRVRVARFLRDRGVPLAQRDRHPLVLVEEGGEERVAGVWPHWPAEAGAGERTLWLEVEGETV